MAEKEVFMQCDGCGNAHIVLWCHTCRMQAPCTGCTVPQPTPLADELENILKSHGQGYVYLDRDLCDRIVAALKEAGK